MAHRLIPVLVPRHPRAAVLVLHGGAARDDGARVSPAQLSVLRMIPVARHLARAGGGQLAVFRLLNTYRGWDSRHTPVQDAIWALDQVRGRFGPRAPTALVGHSLGGRAALLTAGQPGVAAAVALAPWVYAGDRPEVGETPVLIVHGSDDRVARPQNSAAVARTLARALPAGQVLGYVRVGGGRHAMLRHHRQFTGLASGFTVATVLGRPARGAAARILAGERWLEV